MADPEKARLELEGIEREIEALAKNSSNSEAPPDADTANRIEQLTGQLNQLKAEVAAHPSPWSRVQMARHSQRPYTLEYAKHLFQDFTELHGDRTFGDDPALVAGLARFHGHPVVVIGHQKGRDTTQKLHRNFGMPKPEGYRKALRIMRLAAKFNRPIFTFVDTPGAYPGIGSEERGQAEAIARNLLEMARLPVPILVTITGEGGSGGALAIAIGDRILMLENSVYSVISPEGCASITWRDAKKAEQAADALKITAQDLDSLGIVDQIVPEPPGGAQTDPQKMAQILDPLLEQALQEIQRLPVPELLEKRYQKFRHIGQFFREATAT
ncbi:MAG: acetyl-CoA carboxylase carboxyltransferase subunit alpha [Acidobacteria bacterium]|nr:acetyl-CoA carboxylase carboxyltransferase subunit alpha [Acidobacteriota bacterium]MCZ6751158.1 acetyl-CoA carboxylase carboxyltransferase subunit alpha [Acidobacteriota bacterium]